MFLDDLMLSGMKYYFLKAKKLDFGSEMADFLDILSTRKGQDQPQAVLPLVPTPPELLGPSVPEGSWSF